jgi:hypothetical protein
VAVKSKFLVLVVLSFFAVGCTGSFNLTRKVYNYHRSQEDKWADELIFLAVVIIPIYSFSTFADAIVFNSIEFWTGENPVEMSKAQSSDKLVKEGDAEARMSYNPSTDEITIASSTKTGDSTLTLERNGATVSARDNHGNIYTSAMREDGGIAVYNQHDQLVKNFSADEVAKMKEQYLK